MYLGLFVDADLKFEELMASKIKKKANQIVGLIRRRIIYLDGKSFEKLLLRDLTSNISNVVISTCTHIKTSERMQEMATRSVDFMNGTASKFCISQLVLF